MSKANQKTDKAIRYLKILMDACNNSTIIDNSVLDKINHFLKEDTINIEFIFDDATDAKIALLEAQVIAKDMEILLLKEKLKPSDVRVNLRDEFWASLNKDLADKETDVNCNKICHAPNMEQDNEDLDGEDIINEISEMRESNYQRIKKSFLHNPINIKCKDKTPPSVVLGGTPDEKLIRELESALSEEKRKHVSNYNLLIEANKQLTKIPNWIKYFFR